MVTIVGYADAPKPSLTTQRSDKVTPARSAIILLRQKGIPKSQLKTGSRGEASPVVKSKGYEARNRRVEIEVREGTLSPPAAPPVPAPKPNRFNLSP